MERTFRKIIETTREIRFFLFSVFCFATLLSFCQDINLFEEIEGKDLSEKKTIIFNIFPVFPEEKIIPQLPKIELKEEKQEIPPLSEKKHKEEIVEEKEEKKLFLNFKIGNFRTKSMDMNYIDKKIYLDISFYTENYRENSENKYYKMGFGFKDNRNYFNFGISIGTTELPGPIFLPFNIEREWFSVNWNYSREFKNFLFSISHKYYFIEEEKTNFLDLNIEKDFENFKLKTGIDAQIFQNNHNICGFSQDFIFEDEKFLAKIGLKFYNERDLKILPEIIYKLNDNFSIFLNSYYRNPDLWKEVIMDNWKEIKEAKLSPEEIYKGGIKIEFKDTSFEISHSYNDIYVWEDSDLNGLYQPYKTNFWKTSFLFNSILPVTDKISIFFNFQKDIFDREIIYLPEEKFESGIEFKNKNFLFKLFNSYKGERKFSSKMIDGFSLLNFEVSYKNKFEIGAGIYNLLNKEYEIVPDYPGEKRKFLFWIKF
ncbi:MAG: TonB-dependent receptor [Candidatus Omnitrophica bacterium]|nr:TonB-dependent receptor [Candidatus Omnitrophota bacterium]